jgi:hypothetical protein
MSQDGNEGIRWVGQQWQMIGYCGRETPTKTETETASASEAKPFVAMTNTRIARSKVVRIGPRRAERESAVA